MTSRNTFLLLAVTVSIWLSGCATPNWEKFRADTSNSGSLDVDSTAVGNGSLLLTAKSPITGAAFDVGGTLLVTGGDGVYRFDPAKGLTCEAHIPSSTISSPPNVRGVDTILFCSYDGFLYTMLTTVCQQLHSIASPGDVVFGAPLVVGGNAYFVTLGGSMQSVDLGAGVPGWQVFVPLEGRACLAYLPAKDLIVYGNTDLSTVNNTSKVAAYRRDNGNQVWSFPLNAFLLAAPVVGRYNNRGLVVVGTGNAVVRAILDDGTEFWHADNYPGVLIRGIAIGPGNRVFVTANKSASCFDLATGNKLWTQTFPNNYSEPTPPSVSRNGVVYFGNGTTLYALDANAGGTLKWTFNLPNAIQKDTEPMIGSDGAVYVADGYGHFYVVR